MNEKVVWQNDMIFKGVSESGASVQVGGEGGIKPTEMVMMGLAGCTAMDVISILKKKQQEITKFEVQVESTRRDSHPHAFLSAVVHYHVTGDAIDEAAVARSIDLSGGKYCSVSATLEKAMPVGFMYHIYNLAGELVSEGEVVTKAEY